MTDTLERPSDTVTTLPEWKHAVELFLEEGYTYGDRIPDEWFLRAFGLPELRPDMTWAEGKRVELLRLSNFEAMREWMLSEHHMMLSRGEGMVRVITPQEQTDIAMNLFVAKMQNEFRKAGLRLVNLNRPALDDHQRRLNTDAVARLDQLRGMMIGSRARLRALPPST